MHIKIVGVKRQRLQVEPALWLWAPDDGRDRPWRKFQHLYWPLPFSLTFLLWRFGSVKTAIKEKLKLEVRGFEFLWWIFAGGGAWFVRGVLSRVLEGVFVEDVWRGKNET